MFTVGEKAQEEHSTPLSVCTRALQQAPPAPSTLVSTPHKTSDRLSSSFWSEEPWSEEPTPPTPQTHTLQGCLFMDLNCSSILAQSIRGNLLAPPPPLASFRPQALARQPFHTLLFFVFTLPFLSHMAHYADRGYNRLQ